MPSYRQGEASVAGQPAKDFPVTVAGTPEQLSALRGKVVVLNFWASWCPPCKEETPALNRLQKYIAPRNALVLGVSADEDPSAYESFLRTEGVVYPTYRDPATHGTVSTIARPPTPKPSSSTATAKSRANLSAFNNGIRRKCSLISIPCSRSADRF